MRRSPAPTTTRPASFRPGRSRRTNTDVELGATASTNVLDGDSDWREWENPPTYVYLDFHDRSEIVYADYVTLLRPR